MSKERVEIIDVDPELAEKWLGHNTRNRNIRFRTVDSYARDMAAGEWTFTGEPVRFDDHGVLLDGQHRLLAIQKSGATIKMLVLRGLPTEAQDAVDTGMTRKFADVLRLHGEPQSALLAAVTRMVHIWESGSRSLAGSNIKSTNPELLATLTKHPELREITHEANRIANHCALPGSLVGLCWWLFSQLDSEDTPVFFERLASDAGHLEGQPIFELKRTLSKARDVRGERSRTWMAAVTIKAWNAWRDGNNDVTLFRYRPGGSNPERFPEPR